MNKIYTKYNTYFEKPNYSQEGTVEYEYQNKKYKLWYGKVGEKKLPPLLILHGGPGGSHSNLTPLHILGSDREIIFYDQLGCGFSDKPDNKSLWTIERYTDEVQAVVSKLKLKNYHLLGHSWGGMLALSFASKYPEGILSLELMSPIINMPRYIKHTSKKLKTNLSGDYAKVIDDYEFKNIGDPETYKKALLKHLQLHICKFFPKPPELMTRLSHLYYPQVHDAMLGENMVSELNIVGNLKDVDLTNEIKKVGIPILFTCGEIECCPPEDIEICFEIAKEAEFHIFKSCHHMTMIENPKEFTEIVRDFILKYE